MAKKKNDIETKREALIRRTGAYEQAVKQSFANTIDKILKLNKTLPELSQGEMFSFYSLSVKKQKETEKIFRELQSVVTFAIRKGIELEWDAANKECDAFISSTFGRDLSKSKEVAAWYERNTDAMEAFINRSDNGLNLSDRIWKSVQQLREEMEVAMTVSIGEGGSAAATSRKVRQYLNDPDLMFRRFRYKKGEEDLLDEAGNVIGTKTVWGKKWKKRIKDEKTGRYKFIDYDRDSYKVGQGMYKSAARNAMRVARTETTMAYREADHERWKQLDFVVGQEVKLSKNHPAEDICNTLAGRYPKDFNFCGWHPQCFCYVVPITLSTEESLKIANEIANGRDYQPLLDDLKQGKEIDTYPTGFTKWIEKNEEKITSSKSLPYFVKYNMGAVEKVVNPTPSIEERAAERHAARTPEKEARLREYWSKKVEEGNARKKKETGGVNAATPLSPEEKTRRNEIKKEAKTLLGGLEMYNADFGKPMTISNKKINEWLNQPFAEYMEKNEALLTLPKLMKEAKYLGYGADKHDPTIKAHLFQTKINNTNSWIIVREMEEECRVHSISDNADIVDFVIKRKG